MNELIRVAVIAVALSALGFAVGFATTHAAQPSCDGTHVERRLLKAGIADYDGFTSVAFDRDYRLVTWRATETGVIILNNSPTRPITVGACLT